MGFLSDPTNNLRILFGFSMIFFDKDEFMTFSEGDCRLFLIGRLKYRDIFGGTFEMGFCTVFDHHRSRFTMEGDDEYNYSRKLL